MRRHWRKFMKESTKAVLFSQVLESWKWLDKLKNFNYKFYFFSPPLTVLTLAFRLKYLLFKRSNKWSLQRTHVQTCGSCRTNTFLRQVRCGWGELLNGLKIRGLCWTYRVLTTLMSCRSDWLLHYGNRNYLSYQQSQIQASIHLPQRTFELFLNIDLFLELLASSKAVKLKNQETQHGVLNISIVTNLFL